MRLHHIFLFILVFCFSIPETALAQGEPILLTNPSFEDIPRASRQPRGWRDCGEMIFPDESAPDTQPSGEFSVSKAAFDGNTYLGMVVRDNDTYESVSQRLSRPMKKGQCYEFSIYLCRSELYISFSRQNDQQVNYVTPAKLRIYGGYGYCDTDQELIGESGVIINNRWLEYKFKFEPRGNYNYITFRAYYNTPTLFPYNGNILLDNASAIVPIPCDETQEDNSVPQEIVEKTPVTPEPPAASEPPTTPEPAVSSLEPEPEPTPIVIDEPVTPEPEPEPQLNNEPEVTIAGLKKSQLRKGQTIRIDNLYFEANKAIITKESNPILNEIYTFLNTHQDVIVEVGGHTNNLPSHEICDRLSKERAEAVVNYLIQKGITNERLEPRGYGKRRPIANNKTLAGRRKNQRVEIKVLELKNSK